MALGLLVAAEEGRDLAGPLVRLGDHHAARVLAVDHRTELLDELVRRGLALAVALLRLVEVQDGVEPETVDAEVEQNRTMSYIASCTAGFSKLRSGWCEKKRWK